MSPLVKILLVLSGGIAFMFGDLAARWWGQEPFAPVRIAAMITAGTIAYMLFGILTRENEFSTAVIWISIALTTFSVMAGILLFGESLSTPKVAAFSLALIAAYLSTQ